MTNRREKMKEAQGGQGSFPKLDIARRYDLRSENGEMFFRYYDQEKQESVLLKRPIKGVLIGSANMMSAFDDDLGSKGGTYFSTPYFNNSDQVAIIAPDKTGMKAIQKGITAEEAELWIAANTTSGRATKRKVLYVLNQQGIVSIETNMTIAIDQMNHLKDSLLDNYVTLTPTVYDAQDPKISKRAQSFLGKFAAKNPPKYANIELGDAITDEAWEALNGDVVLDEFIAWKKFVTAGKGVPSITEQAGEPDDHSAAEIFPPKDRPAKEYNTKVDYDELDKKREEGAYDPQDAEDDLPF